MRWMQNLHQSTWDPDILCADRSSKDEKILRRKIILKPEKYECGGRLKGFVFRFVETTHELRQTVNDHGHKCI
jgi:hypothetical protein